MKIATVWKASALALALVAGSTSPASAHGDIRYENKFFDEWGNHVGSEITFCDGHYGTWGYLSPYVDFVVNECPGD